MPAKLVVLYGPPQDTAGFDAHYAQEHAPMAGKIPGLRRYDHGRILGNADGSPAPFYYIAELYFDDADALASGMASAEGHAAAEDVPTFATGGATLMVAEA